MYKMSHFGKENNNNNDLVIATGSARQTHNKINAEIFQMLMRNRKSRVEACIFFYRLSHQARVTLLNNE